MSAKRSVEFLDNWDQAKQLEEQGHKAFEDKEYLRAAESHQEAAELFRKILEYIEVDDEEARRKTLGNYYIELANHYHSLATHFFYRGNKEEALTNFHLAAEEQKKTLEEYEKITDKQQFKYEVDLIKISLYFYLAYENLCKAQIAFLEERYSEAVEYFRIAEIHVNLEVEFVSEIGDLSRLKRAKARSFYYKGQIARSEALLAMQNSDRKKAKENYTSASKLFGEAAHLWPEWEEYEDLAKKSRRMASAIKD